MLLAVDEGLGRILQALERRGTLDDTFILFTSDNGFFYGEHGLSLERRLPYEESIRAPMLVRFPAVVRPGSRVDDLVASVDIAPTELEIAGVPIGEHVQGRSFVPSLTGSRDDLRQSVLSTSTDCSLATRAAGSAKRRRATGRASRMSRRRTCS